jgi:hypothetical protein
MDLISILATVILTTTIGTLVVGVAAYAAFKLRDKRKPRAGRPGGARDSVMQAGPVFLTRYRPAVTPPAANGSELAPEARDTAPTSATKA